MRMLIVPNELSDAINAAIDKALDGDAIDADERQDVYQYLLLHWDEHGVIPDFSLVRKEPTE